RAAPLEGISVGTGALKGPVTGAGAAYTLSTDELNGQLMQSLIDERGERDKKCGQWPGPGNAPVFKAW
ncbi:MAG TPA: hypothetical protein VF717_19640, partial [Pyrinomonadaceae bacterium]